MALDFPILLRFEHALLLGLLTTLKLTGNLHRARLLATVSLSALHRTSGSALRFGPVSSVYVEFFRGTPVLIQLFWIFFCLPLILGVELSNLTFRRHCTDPLHGRYHQRNLPGEPQVYRP